MIIQITMSEPESTEEEEETSDADVEASEISEDATPDEVESPDVVPPDSEG